MKIKPHPITFIQSNSGLLKASGLGFLKEKNKPMKHNESKLQSECVKWFRYQFPMYLIFSIPNEGRTSPQAGARMKAAGCLSGIPDLMIAVPSVNYHGLFVEMKFGKGKLTDNQKETQKKLSEYYKVITCYSFDEFQSGVTDYLKT